MFSQVYSLTEWLFVICTLARLLTLHSVQLCDFSWTNVFFTFGISVKWIRKCLLNVSVWLKDFLHSPQHGGFSPLWMNKCSVILHAWVNDLLHGVHHVGLDEHWARFDGVIAEKMRLFHFVEVWHLSSVFWCDIWHKRLFPWKSCIWCISVSNGKRENGIKSNWYNTWWSEILILRVLMSLVVNVDVHLVVILGDRFNYWYRHSKSV